MGIIGNNKLSIEVKIDNNLKDTNEISQISKKVNEENKSEFQNLENSSSSWEIKIPKINLKAKIRDGTTSEVLNKFVGHFDETSKKNGNVGLAAHNRGYEVNYFEKIKLLEKGDKIYYLYDGVEKVYIVNSINIIQDTDWKWLGATKDNRITLITCVEDKPKNRLCVQGIEQQIN